MPNESSPSMLSITTRFACTRPSVTSHPRPSWRGVTRRSSPHATASSKLPEKGGRRNANKHAKPPSTANPLLLQRDHRYALSLMLANDPKANFQFTLNQYRRISSHGGSLPPTVVFSCPRTARLAKSQRVILLCDFSL